MFNWLKRLLANAMTRTRTRKQLDSAFDTAAVDKNALPLDPANDPWRK